MSAYPTRRNFRRWAEEPSENEEVPVLVHEKNRTTFGRLRQTRGSGAGPKGQDLERPSPATAL
jgi:hypothetical protein